MLNSNVVIWYVLYVLYTTLLMTSFSI